MGVTFIAPQGTYTAPAKLVTKEITENGTYDATDDSANGYSSVTVNVEGGGGGSSDFSTAEVTVINTSAEYASTLKGSIVVDVGSEFGTTYEMDIATSQTKTANVIMYKGNSIVYISDVESTSGAIQSIDGKRFLITGNCTITIS